MQKRSLRIFRFPYSRTATDGLYTFKIQGYDTAFGYMLESVVRQFNWPDDAWKLNHSDKTVELQGSTFGERSQMVRSLLLAEKERGTFKQLNIWRDELCPVYGPEGELLLSVDRAGVPLLGVIAYSVQLLAYQRNSEGISLWIARRGRKHRSFAGLLDSTVGGGLCLGEVPFESLIRECWEEASFPEDLVRANAKPCGTVNHFTISESRTGGTIGLFRPKIQFTYDIEVPAEIIPKPTPEEADNIDEFILLNIDGLQHALAKGEFGPATGCIVIDFLIRHGFLTAENEGDYVEIVSRLHRKFDFPTANFNQRTRESWPVENDGTS